MPTAEILLARQELAEVREDAVRQRGNAARARQATTAERERVRRTEFPPPDAGPLLAAEFVGLTRELFAAPSLSGVVESVLQFALASFPPYIAAAATISGTGGPALHIATDPVAEQFDAIQFEMDQGPAVTAMRSSEPVHAPTLASWPALAPLAADLGIIGALAYGLAVPRDGMWHPLGTLTLYSETRVEFDDDAHAVGSMLAAYLAVAAGLDRDRNDLNRREAALHRALSTRDVIGQAKGILMERQHIPAGDAFDILRRTSQTLNTRLHDVAMHIAETGEIPDTPTRTDG